MTDRTRERPRSGFSHAHTLGLAVWVDALRGSDSNRFYARHGFARVEQAEFDNHYLRPPVR